MNQHDPFMTDAVRTPCIQYLQDELKAESAMAQGSGHPEADSSPPVGSKDTGDERVLCSEESSSPEAPDDFQDLFNVDRNERGVDQKIPFKDSGRDYAMPQLEVAVLNIALSKPLLFDKISRELGAADFSCPACMEIYHAMLRVTASGKILSFVDLREELEATWPESASDWGPVLSAIMDSSAWHKHLELCMKKLKEATLIRGGKDYCPYGYSEDFCANLLLSRIPMIRCVSGSWFKYVSGVWEATQKDTFRPSAINAIHPKHRTARRCRDVLDHAESLRQFPGTFRGAYGYDSQGNILLNAANCVLRISCEGEVEQEEHSPDFNFTLKLAADFQADAKCDLFRAKLIEALPDPEDRDLYQVFCGYILEPSCKRETALVPSGSGGTGKSTCALPVADVLGQAWSPPSGSKTSPRAAATRCRG